MSLTSKRPKSIETEVKDDTQALLWSKNNPKHFYPKYSECSHISQYCSQNRDSKCSIALEFIYFL